MNTTTTTTTTTTSIFMNTFIDISWPVNEKTMVWKDSKEFATQFTHRRNWKEHGTRNTNITMNAHTGTHVDARCHFLEDGESIEKTPLEKLQGHCKVFDFCQLKESVQQITREHFERFANFIHEGDVVLLKTRNSSLTFDAPFDHSFVSLAKDAAELLVEKQIKCVGIDFPGIERSDIQKGHETHRQLLGASIPIVEGLRLQQVDADYIYSDNNTDTRNKDNENPPKKGKYFFLCLPLKVTGIDAAPARALLYHL